MAESLTIKAEGKKEKYAELLPQLEALVGNENDLVASMANIAAALKQYLGFFWVGFYIVKGDQLVLGPFQGPVACLRIARGKGVCGRAWETACTVLVPDVDQFPGHIACNSMSKSEIVVPILNTRGEVFAVLDVDSDKLSDFDDTDSYYLSLICALLQNKN